MTNNTPVPWTANGFSLHTMAWSVRSFGGRRFFGPSKRGDDLLIPFRKGRVSTRKSREAQVYDIAMWVLPLTEDGLRPASLTREQQAHENFRKIVAAVDVEGQFPLIKRWWDGTTIKSATAYAEFLEGDGPGADDGTGFDATLTFILADPYFYVPVAEQPLGAVTIEGEAPTDHVTVTFTGGTNPRVTSADGNWVQFQGTPSSPVTFDGHTGMATMGGNYVNGLIVHNPEFPTSRLELSPGAQTLQLSGGGSASFTYEAAYR